MAIFETPLRARARCSSFLAALALLPAGRPRTSGSTCWTGSCIAVIAATGLNILTGFTGQISLGNAAFLAVGAYTTRRLAGRCGLPFLW